MDIVAAAAQCPVFQLQVYGIEFSDVAANVLDMAIGESSYPAMSAS